MDNIFSSAPAIKLSSAITPEISEAIARHSYHQALQLLDKYLETDPASLAAKLWWIRLQLEERKLPLGVLSAPLEELNAKLIAEKSLHPLAVETHYTLAKRLKDKNQLKLAGLVLTSGWKLYTAGPDLDLNTAAKKTFLEEAQQILKDELARATDKRESPAQLATLKHTLEELTQKLKAIGSLQTIPETAPSADQPAVVTPVTTWSLDPTAASPHPQTPTIEANPIFSKRLMATVFSLVALVFLGYYAYQKYLTQQTLKRLAAIKPAQAEIISLPAPVIEPMIPTETKTDSSTQSQALESLKSRLENLSFENKQASSSDQTQPNQPSNQTQAISDLEKQALAKIQTPDLDSNPSITPPARNNSSDGIASLPADKTQPEHAPLLDPSGYAQTKIEDLTPELPPAKRPTQPDLIVDTNPGNLGTPEHRGGAASGPALDGSKLQGYEVDHFSVPIFFKTVTATDVRKAPSLLEAPFAHLRSEAHVKATARLGRWLEIITPDGQSGFIFAQDASPDPSYQPGEYELDDAPAKQ